MRLDTVGQASKGVSNRITLFTLPMDFIGLQDTRVGLHDQATSAMAGIIILCKLIA